MTDKDKIQPPKWDDWRCRMPSVKDQQKAITLFKKSGAATKSDFMRAQILREDFRVLHADLGSMKFYQELTQLVAAVNKTGVLYNQTVKSINMYHTEARAKILLARVSKSQEEILSTLEKVVKLAEEMKNDGKYHHSEKSTE